MEPRGKGATSLSAKSAGKSFYFAGDFDPIGKHALAQIIQGGGSQRRVVNSASPTTHYIVLGVGCNLDALPHTAQFLTPKDVRVELGGQDAAALDEFVDQPRLSITLDRESVLLGDDTLAPVQRVVSMADEAHRGTLDALLGAITPRYNELLSRRTKDADLYRHCAQIAELALIAYDDKLDFSIALDFASDQLLFICGYDAATEDDVPKLGGLTGLEAFFRLLECLLRLFARYASNASLSALLESLYTVAPRLTAVLEHMPTSMELDDRGEEGREVVRACVTRISPAVSPLLGKRVLILGNIPRQTVGRQELERQVKQLGGLIIKEASDPATDLVVRAKRAGSISRAEEFETYSVPSFLKLIGTTPVSRLVQGAVETMKRKASGKVVKPKAKRAHLIADSGSDNDCTEDEDASGGSDEDEERAHLAHDLEKDEEEVLQQLANGLPSIDTVMSKLPSAMTIDELTALTYADRAKLTEGFAAFKKKYGQYGKAIRDYEVFMARKYPKIKPLPIVPQTAYFFVKHEMDRERRQGGRGKAAGQSLKGTSLGYSAIRGIVSALEHLRSESAWQHRDVPDSQRPLREDPNIKFLEQVAREKDWLRQRKAQVLKMTGSTAATLTRQEKEKIGRHFLMTGSSTALAHLCATLRNRAMFIVGLAYGFRGDSTRFLCISDLFIRTHEKPVGTQIITLEALYLFANRGKTNVDNRIDQVASMRARNPLLCPVNAIGMHLWAIYHLEGRQTRLNFAPEYTKAAANEGWGLFGKRSWQLEVLFPASDLYKPMSYSTQYTAVKNLFKTLEIQVDAVTHMGRKQMADDTGNAGVENSRIEQHGLWSLNSQFQRRYQRATPFAVLLSIADFDPERADLYFVPRASIEPPVSLLEALFPWVEDELRALNERVSRIGKHAEDFALKCLCELLQRMRHIILQDAAMIAGTLPNAPFLSLDPFCRPAFREWAETARQRCVEIQREVADQMADLPDRLTSGFTTALGGQRSLLETRFDEIKGILGDFGEKLDLLMSQRSDLALQGPTTSRGVRPAPAATSGAPPPSTSASQTPASVISYGKPATILENRRTQQQYVGDHRFDQMDELLRLRPSLLEDVLFQWKPASLSTKKEAKYGWVPVVSLVSLADLRLGDVYRQYTEGHVGGLSTMQLEDLWGERWRPEHTPKSQRNEQNRRLAIYTYVNLLIAKTSKPKSRVLEYLQTEYTVGHGWHARKFAEKICSSRSEASRGGSNNVFGKMFVYDTAQLTGARLRPSH